MNWSADIFRAYFLWEAKTVQFCTVQSGTLFLRRADKVPGQKAHGRHIVFAAVSALVAGPSGLASPGDGKGITLLAVSAFGNRTRAKPRRPAQEHQHAGRQ
jgi:hypothetical protein